MKHMHSFAGMILTVAQLASVPALIGQPAPVPAPSATQPSGGPRIRFSETNFNFGKIKTSDNLRHDFVVTNTGSAVLEISSVRPACGCTMAGTWDRQIEPGKTGRIPIQLNPANLNGPVTKTIAVTCNDPTQTNHTLHIAATVWKPIDVQPPTAYFTPVEGEVTNELKIVRIVSNLDEPLIVDPPQFANGAVSAELKTLQPGKEFELHVRYSGAHSNAIPNSFITMKTSSTNLPEISVPVRASVRPALTTVPNRIVLPAGSIAPGFRGATTIRNNGSTPVKLSDPAVNAEGITVQITEAQPGKLFALSVNFPTNYQAQAGQTLELTVKTSHPNYPLIKVPITAMVAPARPAVPLPAPVTRSAK
jgi:uncharacterized protein DUF1573